ncbi:mediator of RNA polymerase II transcription subunit 25 [Trichonephila clavipes]|nr:mediator of RNA polymerase II transcription subunit 25 [Trichonephila clavipes]
MVVADQSTWLADVVFVIEGTANMSPYIENLKSNYILPTLEYFNGSPADDRDCGSDTNCTMYALVVFLAADCAPETASVCYAPTASTHKFLSLLDKVNFQHHSGDSTILLGFTQILRNNTLRVVRDLPPLPLPPTSRENLQLEGYLEYPHAPKTLYIYKHPCSFSRIRNKAL